MKKILIFSHALEIGGAERALLGLLNSIDTTKYYVDLFLMRHEGELFQYIPQGVNLLPEMPEYASLAVPITTVIKKRQLKIAIGRAYGKYKAKYYVRKHQIRKDNGVGLEYSHKYTKKFMPNINDEEYDLAISFLTPHYFVAEKVFAKLKIAWIHTDYLYVDLDIKSEKKMWGNYDYITSISADVTMSFLSKFPEFSGKIIEIENIVSPEFIRQQAETFETQMEIPKDDSIKLLSIGRFCEPKNFDNVPDICKRLLDAGMNVCWYIIGFGPDEELIRKKIRETGMENRVIILGKKSNPYPYITACDVYVQPSRYEGKAVTVREAQILGKPVIITDYATAHSQLKNGYDGMIVPMDNEECADAMVKLLKNSTLLKELSENAKQTDYSNSREVEKIYRFLKEENED